MHFTIRKKQQGERNAGKFAVVSSLRGVPSGDIERMRCATYSLHDDEQAARKVIGRLAKKHGLRIEDGGRTARDD